MDGHDAKLKSGFALSLSMDGIVLLHRAAGGWLRVGEVAIDTPDLGDALSDLRARAELLDPGGLSCKLIIPNDQVRYLSVDTDGMDPIFRDRMIEQAVDAATPYALDELIFDTSQDGDVIHVAVVARDTLSEAESFASDHGFNPTSFVATPAEHAFLGEPFFGPSSGMDGAGVVADGIAVVIVGDAVFPQDAGPDITETDPAEPEPEPEPVQDASPESAPTAGQDADPAPVPAIGFSSRRMRPGRAETAPDTPDIAHMGEPDQGSDGDPVPEETSPQISNPDNTDPVSVVAIPEAEPDVIADPEISAAPDVVSAHASDDLIPIRPEAADPDLRRSPDIAAPDVQIPTGFDPTPIAMPDQAPGGFSSRRKRLNAPESERIIPRPTTVNPITEPPVQPKRVSAQDPQDETARMTVFGARKPPKIGGKPRFLGLMLTSLLILLMVAAAAWATLFSPGGLSGLFRDPPVQTDTAPRAPQSDAEETLPTAPTDPVTETAPVQNAPELAPAPALQELNISALPAPVTLEPTETALPAQADATSLSATDTAVLDALRAEDPVLQDIDADVLASLDPEQLADGLLPPGEVDLTQHLPETETPDDSLTSDDQRVLYAATGIWSGAPEQPETPALISLDNLYVASIDRTDLSQDAVALPPIDGLRTDRTLAAQNNPAAAGTTFDLNDRGLVKPSPEGTLTPDGVLVFLGKPPRVPPPTPTRFEETPETDAALDRLAGLRPKPRPGNLAEQSERANLGGLSRSELAGVRPKLRPQSVQQRAEEQGEQTEDAPSKMRLASVIPPRSRPSNIAQLVQRAQKNKNNTPIGAAAASTASTAAPVAVATVTPKIPSSASVSRQATMNNALNLRQVNLIGVYGNPSDRRALVRLPSGTYRKVKVGDKVDGGKVVAIGDSELRYQKRGRDLTLRIPNG